MVGPGGMTDGRSKEAVGMMALHESLRTVCLNSDWTYSVFWTIRPRPRVRGGNACKLGDENGSLWFCGGDMDGEDPVRKAFSKMSIQLYNYGEGLMGKVASDKCHKWVFKEPTECEPDASNSWQSSFDAVRFYLPHAHTVLPNVTLIIMTLGLDGSMALILFIADSPEWTDQFESGIQTIAVIQAGHGLLQLGSCKIIPEDLHFVLRMRHTFESLRYQSGYYLSQLFSSTRNCPSSSTPLGAAASAVYPPVPHISWAQRPLPSMFFSHGLQHPGRLGFPQPKDETLMFLQSHSSENRMEEMMSKPDSDIKWHNGSSFFTGRSEDGKRLFDHDGMAKKLDQSHMSLMHDNEEPNPNEFLSLDSHPDSASKAGNKFKRRSTLQARMRSSPISADQQQPQNPADYRNSKTRMYPDMEEFME